MSRSSKVLLGVLGGAVLVLVLLPVFAGSGHFGSGLMMGQGGMMGGGWGFFGIIWMLVPLLFFGGLVALIVWAVTQLGSGGHAASGRPCCQ
jgi:putative membrane protein